MLVFTIFRGGWKWNTQRQANRWGKARVQVKKKKLNRIRLKKQLCPESFGGNGNISEGTLGQTTVQPQTNPHVIEGIFHNMVTFRRGPTLKNVKQKARYQPVLEGTTGMIRPTKLFKHGQLVEIQKLNPTKGDTDTKNRTCEGA